jgi:hypothetical protein
MNDPAPASPPSHRPLGWKLLIACLVLSVAALVGTLFHAGRTTARHSVRRPPELSVPEMAEQARQAPPPSDDEPNDDGMIHREVAGAMIVGDDGQLVEVFGRQPRWEDLARDVAAREDLSLSDAGAFRLGQSTDPAARWHDTTVRVRVEDAGDGNPRVIVGRGDGFCGGLVGLQFDLNAKRATAGAESYCDAFPQPQLAWKGVHGAVAVSSWDWTTTDSRVGTEIAPDKRPIVIQYELFGDRGGQRYSTHGKVVLAR